MEWRCLPTRIAAALVKEGWKFLRQVPTEERPLALCEVDLTSDDIIPFFEHHLRDPCGDSNYLAGSSGRLGIFHPSGRKIESGMRFALPVHGKDAERTFALLQISWLARCIASISGALEAMDHLQDEPPGKWEDAWQVASVANLNESVAETIARNRAARLAMGWDVEDPSSEGSWTMEPEDVPTDG